MTIPRERPITELLSVLVTQLQRLIKTECQIALSEINENLDRALGGATMLVIALVLLLPALTILLAGAVLALARAGMRDDLAAFIVGSAVLVVGGILAIVGIKRLKSVKLVPKRALNQLQRDVVVVNPMRHTHEHSAA